jgi:hypothetical protein
MTHFYSINRRVGVSWQLNGARPLPATYHSTSPCHFTELAQLHSVSFYIQTKRFVHSWPGTLWPLPEQSTASERRQFWIILWHTQRRPVARYWQRNITTKKIKITMHACFINSLREINSVALVRERNIPTERLPLVGEVSANFGVGWWAWRVPTTVFSDF